MEFNYSLEIELEHADVECLLCRKVLAYDDSFSKIIDGVERVYCETCGVKMELEYIRQRRK